MLTGLTTQVVINKKTYHIQTEDKGKELSEIETLIYFGGQVMAAWRISYAQLLNKGNDDEVIYRLMQLQHKEIAEQIKQGILSFDKTDIQLKSKTEVEDSMDDMIINFLVENLEVEELKLKIDTDLELKKGNQLKIKVRAQKNISSAPIKGAKIIFSIVGDSDSQPEEIFRGFTDSSGYLQASFFIPNFSGRGALVIDALSTWGKDRVIEYIKENS